MSSHTATEKILARASGKKEVSPGDIVTAKIDVCFSHSPWNVLSNMEQMGATSVFDPDKVVLGLSHHVFLPASQWYANKLDEARRLAAKFGIKHIYDMGTGNGHILVMENGHIWPGGVAACADSHSTCYGALGAYGTPISGEFLQLLLAGEIWFKVPSTIQIRLEGTTRRGVCARDVGQVLLRDVGLDGALWRTLEFAGSYISSLSVYQRMVLTFLAAEMGAASSYIAPDEKTLEFVKVRVSRPFEPVYNDPGCEFEAVIEYDVSQVEPCVAKPHAPNNTATVRDVEGTPINQAFVGGCTGSSLEDLRMAAEVVKGRKVKKGVRFIVVPGTYHTMRAALADGTIETLVRAGAIITAPWCGPCQMMCVGWTAEGERSIGTHPRNWPGRAGKGVEVYLASPYTVAASALTGEITDPRRFLEGGTVV